MKKTTRVFLFTTALVAALAVNANATILYSTNFNSPTYADGNLNGQDSWAAHSSAGTNPIAVANSATNGTVTLATSGEDDHRNWTPGNPAVTSGSVFLSADINVASAQAAGDYFLHLGDGGSSLFYD